MRFLCFHGMGTNGKIFEAQTARLRQALGRQQEFVFLTGTVPTTPAVGTESAFGGAYCFSGHDLAGLKQMYEDLLRTIYVQGPFDGVMGFSEGAAVAMSLLVQDAKAAHKNFKCGIFFCAATPEDPDVVSTGVHRDLIASTDGVVIDVPTAHIWSSAGDIHPGMGRDEIHLCNAKMREEFVHNLGHTVPGFGSDEGVSGALRAIERTIERAR